MFYSQWGQMNIYNNFFKIKKWLFFRDRYYDGLRFSTVFFEKELNWNGIAIEARESAYNKLLNNRKCICINTALSNNTGEIDFLELKGYGIGLSGIIDKYDYRHLNRIRNEIEKLKKHGREVLRLKTEKLNDILDKHNIINIDFLFIDTEVN